MRSARNSIEITEVIEWRDGEQHRVSDYLAGEEPLEIRIGATPLTVTMRTPGHDLELAAGFLLTEGILERPEQLAGVRTVTNEKTGKQNIIEAKLTDSEYDSEQMQRNFFAASSCGICGKTSIESIRQRGLRELNPGFRVSPEVLCSLSDKMRGDQAAFEKTGGLHAAGLFTPAGELLEVREDIGRHNAVDKIVGWAVLNKRLPLAEHILLVSGRGGFEIAQKAIAAGIPVVASVSAPSSLAVRLARELRLTLVGFLRGSRFVIYSGAERVA